MFALDKVSAVFNYHGNLTMQLKALLLCAAVAAALNIDLSAAEQSGVPHGWTATPNVGKQFEVGFDAKEGATYVRSVGDPGRAMGGIMQAISAKPFVGKDVRLDAEVKAEGDLGRAELYIRAKAGEHSYSGASWKTPKEWTPVSVQLSQATGKEVDTIDFGLLVQGKGRVWLRNLQLKAVDAEQRAADNTPLHPTIDVPNATDRVVNLELRP
jgi:hypothetical protein